MAALFLDLDGLKEANGQLGHAAGDALQSMVAAGRVHPQGGHGARLGGDEFGVIVEDFAHPGEVFALAERILDECRKPMDVGDATVWGR